MKLPDNVTWLKQPNLITLMSCDLSKMQMRAVVVLIEALQEDINRKLSGAPYSQLFLFKDEDKDRVVKVSIPIRNFGVKPYSYPDLREAIKNLAKIPVEIDINHPETGAATFNTTLLSAIIPIEGSQRKNVIFRIEREVAKCLVQIDIPNNLGYTKYVKEIALNARSKYTIRMYMLIASWRDKGGFSMDVGKFKHWLQIEDTEYPDWKDIEKRVLKTAEEELHEKADCWFHYSPVYDQDVSLQTPYRIDFKVIRTAKEEDVKLLTNMKQSLYNVFINLHLSSKQASEIRNKINIENYMFVRDKVFDLYSYIQSNISTIRTIPEYFYSSMMKFIDELDSGE